MSEIELDRARLPPAPPSIAQHASLFIVLAIVANGLIVPGLMYPGLITASILVATFHLALFAHVVLALYVGAFGALRTATWTLLISARAGSEIATLAGFVLPWMHPPWPAQLPIVGDLRAVSAALWPSLLLLILGLDVAVAHGEGWRRRSLAQIAVFLVAVIATAIAVSLVLSWFVPASAPSETRHGQYDAFAVVPAWHALPLYALLRAMPDKLGGVIVMCAALLVPMIGPWMRADILRTGRTRWTWRLLSAMLGASWIGLGFLGTQPREGLALHAAQILAIFYFAYFLVLPIALHRIAGSPQPA